MLLFLDKHRPFGYVQTVMTPSPKQSAASWRIISAALLLFVFFLPLHFHFYSGAKVAKECACVQGTRLNAGPVPAPPIIIPVFDFQLVAFVADEDSGRLSISSSSIRAPPALAVF